MPTNNKKIKFKFGTQAAYDAIVTKDTNAVYFTTDTKRIYVGDIEYTDDTTINTATKQYIDNAIGGITEFDTYVVNELPQSGVKGVIYFIPHNHGVGDTYDEYIWVGNAFEKIGNTDIDLSGFIPVVQNATGNIPKMKSDGKLEDSGIASSDIAVKSDYVILTQSQYDNLATKTAFLYLIIEEDNNA